MRTEELLQAALELPEHDRVFLATRLFESVPEGDGASLDDPLLFDELDRRFNDLTGALPASALWTGA